MHRYICNSISLSGIRGSCINWRLENNWLIPPNSLVSRAINPIIMCESVGTLIIPKWPPGVFWTLLFGKNMKYRQYVVEFEPNQNVFKHDSNSYSLFGSGRFNSRVHVLAVRLCADKYEIHGFWRQGLGTMISIWCTFIEYFYLTRPWLVKRHGQYDFAWQDP